MCDLDRRDLYFIRNTLPYNGEHLCQVILKSLNACRSFAPDKRFSMTSKCDLDLDLASWFMCATQLLIVVNIFMKSH
jgi:hypothetical protein